jgi:hypothetical protein
VEIIMRFSATHEDADVRKRERRGNHHGARSAADFAAESAPQEPTPERHLLAGGMGTFGQRGFPISPSR